MELYFKKREEWRAWLAVNHGKSSGVWLVYYKKASGKPGIEYSDAVEEALCFGWIDSKIKSVNADYYVQWFTPRRPGSLWSKYNIERVQRLIKEGRMTVPGLVEYQKALDNPQLVYENRHDADPEIPQDLLDALRKNKAARDNFINFPPSARRIYIFWLNSAKREITRQTRILKIVDNASKNIKPGINA